MNDDLIHGLLDQAHSSQISADIAILTKEKVLHLCEASGFYLRAIETVDDEELKLSLAYLACQTANEASIIKESISYWNSKSNFEVTNTVSSEIAISCDRIIDAAHLQRLHGLQKIPKAKDPSEEQIVNDVLALEKKLSTIGLYRSPSDHIQRKKKTPEMSVHLSSTLGESFMVLPGDQKPRFQSDKVSANGHFHTRVGIVDEIESGSSESIDFSEVPLPPVKNSLPFGVNTPPSNGRLVNSNKPAEKPSIVPQKPSIGYQIPILPFWPTTVTAQVPSEETNGKRLPKETAFPPSALMDHLEWNEKSTFLCTKEDDFTEPVLGEESINRLLNSIATLRDENARLEEANEQITLEMMEFKMDYVEKIAQLKRMLEANKAAAGSQVSQTSSHNSGNISITGFGDPASNSMTQENRKQIALLEKRLQEAKTKEINYLKRQQDLEQIVNGLMKKYNKLKDDLRNREKSEERELQGSGARLSSDPSVTANSPKSSPPTSPIAPLSNLRSYSSIRQLSQTNIPNRHKHPSTSTLESLHLKPQQNQESSKPTPGL